MGAAGVGVGVGGVVDLCDGSHGSTRGRWGEVVLSPVQVG